MIIITGSVYEYIDDYLISIHILVCDISRVQEM